MEKRFHAELDDVLGDRDATPDDLPNLHLTGQVGTDPHQCIGEGFAWMEARIALATLHQHWRATTSSRAEIMPRTTLKVKGGMPMTLERRS